MTGINKFYKLKKSSKLQQNTTNIDLLVHGQCVFIFKTDNNQSTCLFHIYNNDNSNELKIEFTTTNVIITKLPKNESLIDINNKEGLINKNGAFYWVSIDSQNQKIYCGIGEPRIETIIYSYKFSNDDKLNWENNKLFLESLVKIIIPQESSSIKPLKLLRDPITDKIPMIVKNTDEVSMTDISQGEIIPKSNLSQTAQKLYDCISGKKFILNTKDFPDFSKAIEYSIATPNCWCNTTLIKKSKEFSKDPNIKETYLRITLGQNNGESPGIPYVMEIWPIGHYSPIHNHAGAHAIIRVLHGSINVSLYPFLSQDNIEPFSKKDFKKDDITWISPTINQIHQLKNLDDNTKTCITIQCYMYDEDNTEHHDYFDYLDEDSKVQYYEPDSDMDFIQFKEKMREEWNARKLWKKLNCFS